MNLLRKCLSFSWARTPIRQEYIIRNLRFEHDLVDEDAEDENTENTEESSPGKKTSSQGGSSYRECCCIID